MDVRFGPRTNADADEPKYACLVYHDEKKLGALTQAELDALVADCVAWVEDLNRSGHHVFSAGLQSPKTATTVQNRNGKVSVTDGPFAETKEVLGGFTILAARDLNEAISLAEKLPCSRIGRIEVRPVMDGHAEMSEPLDRRIAAAIRRSAQPA